MTMTLRPQDEMDLVPCIAQMCGPGLQAGIHISRSVCKSRSVTV
jgi:hypothetical protein